MRIEGCRHVISYEFIVGPAAAVAADCQMHTTPAVVALDSRGSAHHVMRTWLVCRPSVCRVNKNAARGRVGAGWGKMARTRGQDDPARRGAAEERKCANLYAEARSRRGDESEPSCQASVELTTRPGLSVSAHSSTGLDGGPDVLLEANATQDQPQIHWPKHGSAR